MAAPVYRFDNFRLDPAKRELWRGDSPVPLQLKVFDCLAYLIANRDRAVGREELIAAVWGKVDVTDNVLGQIIARARHAVDDSGEQQRVIRTVLRFGYRWAGPVVSVEDDDTPVSAGSREPAGRRAAAAIPERSVERTQRAPPWRYGLALALVMAAAIAVFASWRLAPTHDRAEPAPAPTGRNPQGAAVILPAIVDADSDFAWVRLGIMDLIAQRLREAGQSVVPSDAVVAMARQFETAGPSPANIGTIAEATAATVIVEIRATLAKGRWRVQLKSLHGHEPPIVVGSDSEDVLEAAREAADRLADALGLPTVPNPAATPEERATARLLQRTKAAILANRLDDAAALLANVDAAHRTKPEARYLRAQIELYAGRFDAARKAFDALIADASAVDDPIMRALALYGSGLATVRQSGDETTALQRFDEAVRLTEPLNTPESRDAIGRVLHVRGVIRMHRREFDAAQADFARARISLESVGNAGALASLDNNSGMLMIDRDRPADALPFFRRAIDRESAVHDVTTELRARINLVSAHLALLEPAKALAEDVPLRETLEKAADPGLRAFGELARVELLIANGRLRDAEALLRATRPSLSQLADRRYEALAAALAADIGRSGGLPQQALREGEASMNGAWGPAPPLEYGRAMLALSEARLAAGHREAAGASADALRAWAERNGSAQARILAALAKAEIAAANAETRAARAAFDEALVLADSVRIPSVQLRVVDAYVAHLVGIGELAAASIVAQRVAGWTAQDFGAALVPLRLYRAAGDFPAWNSALADALALAGERKIPDDVAASPAPSARPEPREGAR